MSSIKNYFLEMGKPDQLERPDQVSMAHGKFSRNIIIIMYSTPNMCFDRAGLHT